jgi:hypothetical protein
MRQILRCLLLSVFLLLAQQGVVTHAFDHLHAQAQAGGEPADHDGQAPCVDCVAFSHVVFNGSQGDVHLPLLADLGFVRQAGVTRAGATTEGPPPRSRGPPILL